jgi:hypothetical protein
MYHSVRFITEWQNVSPEVIVKGFKKCCISSGMDGTNSDMLCHGSVEDGDLKS